MSNNPVQFAVVREDPLIESTLLDSMQGSQVLLIASGGCTGFHLSLHDPRLSIDLLDPNPAQLNLIEKKISLMENASREALGRQMNVGTDSPQGLNACGNFESLFRCFRDFLFEFVAPKDRWISAFGSDQKLQDLLAKLSQSRYWTVAFELFFSDSLLNAVFGSKATQHARKGSYPSYFKNALESGMKKPRASSNYFLHHIFLGHYLPGFEPGYLKKPLSNLSFQLIEGPAESISDYGKYDFIHLSNIFDWMDPSETALTAARISRQMKPGAKLLIRQLNNTKNITSCFNGIEFDFQLAGRLLEQDRSLFYNRILIGTKRN